MECERSHKGHSYFVSKMRKNSPLYVKSQNDLVTNLLIFITQFDPLAINITLL